GLADLVVLGGKDGTLSLLLGGRDGPQLATVLHAAGLVSPSDLTLASVGDGRLDVYVSTEGPEGVVRLSFVLDLAPVLPAGTVPPIPQQQTSEFASLGGAPLEVVTILLFVPLEQGPESESGGVTTADLEGTAHAVTTAQLGGGNDEAEEEVLARLTGSAEDTTETGGARELNAFVLGVDALPF